MDLWWNAHLSQQTVAPLPQGEGGFAVDGMNLSHI
jgi:hypothetical protein